MSAGQTILALAERGIECALCVRSPIRFRKHGPTAWLREMAYFFWEELEATCKPGLHRNSYPTMEGGRNRRLVETGSVPVYPAIQEVADGLLHFADGASSQAAAVILATGYRPSLGVHGFDAPRGADGLPETTGFEVTSMPGVFLLGFDNLYDHRSRYLRGIRADAKRLARRLSALTPS